MAYINNYNTLSIFNGYWTKSNKKCGMAMKKERLEKILASVSVLISLYWILVVLNISRCDLIFMMAMSAFVLFTVTTWIYYSKYPITHLDKIQSCGHCQTR